MYSISEKNYSCQFVVLFYLKWKIRCPNFKTPKTDVLFDKIELCSFDDSVISTNVSVWVVDRQPLRTAVEPSVVGVIRDRL